MRVSVSESEGIKLYTSEISKIEVAFSLLEQRQQALDAETEKRIEKLWANCQRFNQTLPIEYSMAGARPEAWRPQDCIAVFKVRHILMGVFEGKLWHARLVRELGPERAAELLKGYQPGHLLIIPPGAEYDGPAADALEELTNGAEAVNLLKETDVGSNSWVLAGGRTASGKPLMAGDPHRGLDVPNVYYQNHVSCPDFDVIGLSFPGCPGFPHFGHNSSVAWCVTHAGADYQDLYIERFDESSPNRYQFKGEWKTAEVRRETIEVRDGDPVEIDLTVTHHGPIVAGDPSSGHALAFKYTSTAGPNHGVESIRSMLDAGSTDEMDEAMRQWVDPCNNFMFADVGGNIGYLNRGQVPIRSMANAWLPVPGWTGSQAWDGIIPFEELARSKTK